MRVRTSSEQDKIDWLLANPRKWEWIDTGSGMFYHEDQRERIQHLAVDIKEAGLYSDKTAVQDIILGLRKLIQKAREQHRFRAAGSHRKIR
jgi:hypothetical protein